MRGGWWLVVVFLELNGLEVNAAEDDYEQLVLQVAQGTVDKQAIATFFRTHTG